ncbi:hypothetical protein PsYK624_147740 [Phanerochaete sordida]|uniref:SWI5-dependent HO expression protein 3 n=1 Tax=Phanerochaete sordida TaxID=48140 RepID=A0A9P3GN91_9APHY|nr:hypothetical protein PsYK624_147740 [Phanerochaete sordida]
MAGRSQSPIVTYQDESVAIRTQMSTLKHTIRQQQAQLHSLENNLLRGPRPLPPGILSSPPMYPDDLDNDPSPSSARSHSHTPSTGSTSQAIKLQRRSSYEVLSGLAGPESSLPLPRPNGNGVRPSSYTEESPLSIREGIPVTSPSKRVSSPTRTLSRIPISSVGHARALAEEDSGLGSSTSSLQAPSPNKRMSFTPGNTTRVLADLQAGVLNAKNALENTKGQLRLSQRQVSQLTRQTEDLKEVRERLRLENEGLNNVVARKERLLQEVLERARKAEAEVVTLKSQLKTETSTSKKSLREMETALTEAQARSQKCEREYITLRDSLKGLVESFKRDHDGLREEMRKREEKLRKEAEEVRKKYTKLIEEVRKEREEEGRGMKEVMRLKDESVKVTKEIEEGLKDEVARLRAEVDRSNKESEGAIKTAKHLAEELARLRRLMRNAGSAEATAVLAAEAQS